MVIHPKPELSVGVRKFEHTAAHARRDALLGQNTANPWMPWFR
jgi:hypothetical protein